MKLTRFLKNPRGFRGFLSSVGKRRRKGGEKKGTLKRFKVYSLQSTVYSLQSTVYSLQSTLYSLQSTVYMFQTYQRNHEEKYLKNTNMKLVSLKLKINLLKLIFPLGWFLFSTPHPNLLNSSHPLNSSHSLNSAHLLNSSKHLNSSHPLNLFYHLNSSHLLNSSHHLNLSHPLNSSQL